MANVQAFPVVYEEGVSSPGNVDLSGGELIITIMRLHHTLCRGTMDIARLNMLSFLAEGECDISSEILFSRTRYGPKSGFIQDFTRHNREIIENRRTGGRIKAFTDSDMRIKLRLTEQGMEFSTKAINFLTVGKLRALSHVISKWGD